METAAPNWWMHPGGRHVRSDGLYAFRFRGTEDVYVKTFESLQLTLVATAEVQAHLNECEVCRKRLERLREEPPTTEIREFEDLAARAVRASLV